MAPKGFPTRRAATERLVEVIADRRVLLVLDNCEHLVAEVADLVDSLLAACPRLRVLTTSREPLSIPGEHLHPVGPLGLPPVDSTDDGYPSVQLFVDRARAVRPDFAIIDKNREAIAEICRRLDGMPLAIELAAARLRALTPQQIVERLNDRFRLLTSGSRTALPRHQTLRAVVEWSWDLLDRRRAGRRSPAVPLLRWRDSRSRRARLQWSGTTARGRARSTGFPRRQVTRRGRGRRPFGALPDARDSQGVRRRAARRVRGVRAVPAGAFGVLPATAPPGQPQDAHGRTAAMDRPTGCGQREPARRACGPRSTLGDAGDRARTRLGPRRVLEHARPTCGGDQLVRSGAGRGGPEPAVGSRLLTDDVLPRHPVERRGPVCLFQPGDPRSGLGADVEPAVTRKSPSRASAGSPTRPGRRYAGTRPPASASWTRPASTKTPGPGTWP